MIEFNLNVENSNAFKAPYEELYGFGERFYMYLSSRQGRSLIQKLVIAFGLLTTASSHAVPVQSITTTLSQPGDTAGANYTAGNGNTFSFNHYEGSDGITGIHQDGFRITQEVYEDIGFAFFERDANNTFHIAAITAVDSAGNASAFGNLVEFGNNATHDWGNELAYNNSSLYGLPSGLNFESLCFNGVAA